MFKHFEELWEAAESYYLDTIKETAASSILDEAILKLTLLRSIDTYTEVQDDQKSKMKIMAYGEAMMALTQYSLKENINAFASLYLALRNKKKIS